MSQAAKAAGSRATGPKAAGAKANGRDTEPISGKAIDRLARQYKPLLFPDKDRPGEKTHQAYFLILMLRAAEKQQWNVKDFLSGLPPDYTRTLSTGSGLPRVIVDALIDLYEEADGYPTSEEMLRVISQGAAGMRVQFESFVQYQIMEQDISFGDAQYFLSHVRDIFGDWMQGHAGFVRCLTKLDDAARETLLQLLLNDGPDSGYNQVFHRQMQAAWREAKHKSTVFAIGTRDHSDDQPERKRAACYKCGEVGHRQNESPDRSREDGC